MLDTCNKVVRYLNNQGFGSRVKFLGTTDRPYVYVDNKAAKVFGRVMNVVLPVSSSVLSKYGPYIIIQDDVLRAGGLEEEDLVYVWEHEYAHIQHGHVYDQTCEHEDADEVIADMDAIRKLGIDYDTAVGIKFMMLDLYREHNPLPKTTFHNLRNTVKRNMDIVFDRILTRKQYAV